jgi:hypothetical protein
MFEKALVGLLSPVLSVRGAYTHSRLSGRGRGYLVVVPFLSMTHKQILQIAIGRMKKGVKKHGRFDARTDGRDLFTEMQEELFDNINYSVMQIQKLEVLKQKLNAKRREGSQ